jgi:hypothetical protein
MRNLLRPFATRRADHMEIQETAAARDAFRAGVNDFLDASEADHIAFDVPPKPKDPDDILSFDVVRSSLVTLGITQTCHRRRGGVASVMRVSVDRDNFMYEFAYRLDGWNPIDWAAQTMLDNHLEVRYNFPYPEGEINSAADHNLRYYAHFMLQRINENSQSDA